MTITLQRPSAQRAPMTSLRKTALVAGLFYLITFASSIPTLALYGPAKKLNFIVGTGSVAGAQWGALLEVICALSGIGTAVALYPIVKRQNQAAALGFVTSRVLEASMIVVGAVSFLSVVTLRQDSVGASGADKAALIMTGKSLVAFHDWTFVLGQSLMPAISALLLGSLLYRSRLVPRAIPVIGLIGAPLLLTSVAMTVFGIWDQVSTAGTIAAFPVALWEFSVGVWMVVKGFQPSAITSFEDNR
ncbi:MAG: hypothetical protein JWN95_1327 [Frankiales bacterium]|nr:hypothetical protein [Frankiales bacterium]